MFTGIEFERFGIFGESTFSDVFSKLNLIYGRNYSGKTTLSRAFAWVALGQVPSRLEGAGFRLLSNEGELSSGDISEKNSDIFVYNSDYIRDNLKFLNDQSTEIPAFAILGAENSSISNKIDAVRSKIDSRNGKIGFAEQFHLLHNLVTNARAELTASEKSFENLKKDSAKSIKEDRNLNVINYNRKGFDDDANFISGDVLSFILSEEEIRELTDIIKSEIQEPLEKLTFPSGLRSAKIDFVTEALNRDVRPSITLERLAADPALAAWVRVGMPLHEDREACGYCGQTLPAKLDEELNKHFSEEVLRIESDLAKAILVLKNLTEDILNISFVDETKISPRFRQQAAEIIAEFKRERAKLLKKFDAFSSIVLDRQANLLHATNIQKENNIFSSLEHIIGSINKLITQNNTVTDKLEDEKVLARVFLRLDRVARKLASDTYQDLVKNIQDTERRMEILEIEQNGAELCLTSANEEISKLELLMRDERRAAEAINVYLNSHFGADSIKFEVDDSEEGGSCFRLTRGSAAAFNLSEGEKSLVAFCYFLATLKSSSHNNSERTIYIDDPISSLDASHVFFIFSLIESEILFRRDNYKQVFISTHSLEFLKYMQRFSHKKEESSWLHVRRRKSGSEIGHMPRHLKEYATEYVYLFERITECADENCIDERYYGFGNEVRKFIELYFFFRFPNVANSDKQRAAKENFCGGVANYKLVDRVVNETSHLSGAFDRAMTPLEEPELRRVAQIILDGIQAADPKQFEALQDASRLG